MTGTCNPDKGVQKSSDPLALEQFLSAFLMLMFGIFVAGVLLLMEHIYFKYIRHHLAKGDRGGCCALLSLVSLNIDQFETIEHSEKCLFKSNNKICLISYHWKKQIFCFN